MAKVTQLRATRSSEGIQSDDRELPFPKNFETPDGINECRKPFAINNLLHREVLNAQWASPKNLGHYGDLRA